MSTAASAQLQFMPKIDAVLARPTQPNALYESSRWIAPGQESVAPLLRADDLFSIALFTGATEPVDLVESGDVAYVSGGTTWVFGGDLDPGALFLGGAGRTAFRGISDNGPYVAFWAGLVAQGTVLVPVPEAEKVGIFRLYLVGPSPVVEAIAIDGEPVLDFSSDVTFNGLFPGAVWRLPTYVAAGYDDILDATIVPARFEPRLGKSAGVALNPIGRIAFRAAVTISSPTERTRGVVFAEDSSGDLRFVAIEREPTALIETDLAGAGDVTPTLLGRPTINEEGVIAFYALTEFADEEAGSGVFHWDNGALTTLMHGNMNPNPAALGVFRVEAAPQGIFTTACGVEGPFLNIFFSDQPSMNCDGQVAFRASVIVTQFDDVRESIWRWTNDGAHSGLGTYERIFTEGDTIPGGGGTISVDPKLQVAFPGIFARPSLNGFGEIACHCGVDVGSIDLERAIVLLDRDGVKRTIAMTNSTAHQFLDVNGVAQTPTDLGNRRFQEMEKQNDLSLNDRGQAAFMAEFDEGDERAVLFYTEVLAAGAGLGAAIHSGHTFDVPGPGSMQAQILNGGDEGATYLGFAAGATGDGDATLTREGAVVWDLTIPVYDSILSGVFATQLPKTPACAADVNQDNVCDSGDLGQMLNMYGQQCSGCPEDINEDGIVDTADLGLFLAVFGRYCAACEEMTEGSPESLMVDAGGESLLRILGFNELADLRDWLGVSSQRDREAFIEDAVEVISLAK